MSSPAEQQPTASSRWWVRPCQWLFRGLLFLWITVLLGLALNVGATWLTTKGFEPQGTALEWIIGQLPVALAGSGALLALTVVAGVLGRQDTPSRAHASAAVPTQQSRSALIRLL